VEGPRAPFTFHDDEPLIGEGPLLRTRRRRWGTVALVILLLAVAAGLVILPRWLAERDLDPAVNARTGLADGRYAIAPTASLHGDDGRCWFRGPVDGLPDAGEVTVAGSGAAQCAGRGDYVGFVEIDVTDGVADITRAGGYR
jgi:hypothetical protein